MSASQIVTGGTGSAEQRADRAVLTGVLTVTARNRAALDEELTKQKSALARLPLIAAQEIRSSGPRVQGSWRGKKPFSFAAWENIDIVVSDLGCLEAVVSALAQAAPDVFDSPRWILADPSAAYVEAQFGAVEDARDKAEGYAVALGGSLGHLIQLTESTGPERPVAPRFPPAAPDVRTVWLEPDIVHVEVQCSTTWALNF